VTTAAPGGVLVVGYGNELRTDDGVGPAVAARLLDDPRLEGTDVLAAHQLMPELAFDASRASLLVLVDAAVDVSAGVVSVRHLDPDRAGAGEPMTHHVDPAGIVTLAAELFGAAPPVVLVSVGAASMDLGDGLTPVVEAAVPHAVDAVLAAIEAHRRA
jgi:hydrogenase maturation protease